MPKYYELEACEKLISIYSELPNSTITTILEEIKAINDTNIEKMLALALHLKLTPETDETLESFLSQITASDPLEKRLAEAVLYLKKLKAEQIQN
jgi:hypothetical protein